MKKKMILKTLLALCLPLSVGAVTKEFNFMGKDVTVKSKDKKALEGFIGEIKSNKDKFFTGLDNECLYKNAKTEDCRAEIEFAFNTKIKMKNTSSETKKKYRSSFLDTDVEMNKTSFINALSIIEDSKSSISSPWQMNFYGQIYQAKGSGKAIHVSSPLMTNVSFLKLDNYEGWAISQTSDVSGGVTVTKGKKQKLVRPDFLKLVLFAGPDFSGSKLYGWSKALMLDKGLKLLKKLEKNKKFRDKWAYAYFDLNSNLVCSKNLNCDLSNPLKITAKANW